jgi:histidine ammonia-lyase
MSRPALPFALHQPADPVLLTGADLTVDELVSVARGFRPVALAPGARQRMDRCRHVVDFLIDQQEKVYGLTTGFGKLRDKVIPARDTQRLQYNLIRSHACGVGAPLPEDATRAAILLRANTLCKGNSGIRTAVVELILAMLNQRLYPLIPEKGSVGASGDLAPLSHIVLALIGDPEGQLYARPDDPALCATPRREDFVTVRQIRASSGESLRAVREVWERFEATKVELGVALAPERALEAKEGLALNNGTQIMTGIAALALRDAYFTLRASELAAALSLEANRGVPAAYDPRIHRSRGQSHQAEVAARVIRWCEGSQILALLLNSAHLDQAGKKLAEAREHLDDLRAELGFRGLSPALLDEVDGAIGRLRDRLERLIPPATPGPEDDPELRARREHLRQLAALDFKRQIPELNQYLGRARLEATGILSTVQQPNFSQGEASPKLLEALTEAVSRLSQAVPATPPVQDDYSLRCFPQVLACAYRAVEHVHDVVHAELNAATDNPLIFPPEADAEGPAPADPAAYRAWLYDPERCEERVRACREGVLGGGNFHGEPVAIAMDYFAIALAEVGNISERRIAHVVDASLSQGLPGFLIDASGLNSGFMIPQYTAASLVSENKVLCHPASVDSIPTCANSEDHVSMGTIAARKAAEVLANVRQVIAIELLTARQALHFRRPMRPGDRLRAFLNAFSAEGEGAPGDPARLRFHADDRVMHASLSEALAVLDDPALRALIEREVPYTL